MNVASCQSGCSALKCACFVVLRRVCGAGVRAEKWGLSDVGVGKAVALPRFARSLAVWLCGSIVVGAQPPRLHGAHHASHGAAREAEHSAGRNLQHNLLFPPK